MGARDGRLRWVLAQETWAGHLTQPGHVFPIGEVERIRGVSDVPIWPLLSAVHSCLMGCSRLFEYFPVHFLQSWVLGQAHETHMVWLCGIKTAFLLSLLHVLSVFLLSRKWCLVAVCPAFRPPLTVCWVSWGLLLPPWLNSAQAKVAALGGCVAGMLAV